MHLAHCDVPLDNALTRRFLCDEYSCEYESGVLPKNLQDPQVQEWKPHQYIYIDKSLVGKGKLSIGILPGFEGTGQSIA